MDTLSRDPTRSEWIVTTLVILFIIALVGGTLYQVKTSADARWETQYRALYPIWCKTYERHDLTYDEWRTMYRANLLPKTLTK